MTAPLPETIAELRVSPASPAYSKFCESDEYQSAFDDCRFPESIDNALFVAFRAGFLTAAARGVESEAEIAALKAENERLREAVAPFKSGPWWGSVKAWITNGATSKAEGIAAAKRITEWQVALSAALLPPAGDPS